MSARVEPPFGRRTRGPHGLGTREALLLALFATALVLARAALRGLQVSGHSMFGTALLLVLARTCVNRAGAATLAGALAGAASAALGMGGAGALLVAKLALPGIVVDLAAVIAPAALRRPALAALVGAAAGATDFLPVTFVEAMGGSALDLVLRHAASTAGAKAAFGSAGAAAGAALAARLRHYGILPAEAGARGT